ncbi:hypothetical protein E4T66_05260 [Sinimarinibacterium sp. CAU 1509]|uniref:hypothetical protein n=1 Tax=Sinimarinibacterium sp. CAU 1509 TaxID=2562283 RepID=UPI0010AD114A|nr:hypothetical protein [Sinimarinibacterium sp. CAU 1509]TJY63121.1 hypothetical protein E4T66_05260 [Sinimarinibacterium sp. CAU 1509]
MNIRFIARAAGAAGVVIASAWTAPTLACSTCKCGDPTVNLFGTEKSFSSRLRIGFDYLVRSETQGDPSVNERQTDEQRLLLGLAYSPLPNLSLAVQVPYVHKQIEDSNRARQDADGLGDIDLIGRWTLLRSGAMSGRHLAGLRLGVRLPTADEVEDGDGRLLDIDVQPDAGATVPNLGGWYAYFRFPWHIGVTATYFSFGDGHQDFSPGDAVVASVLGQYGVTTKLAVQLGLDARHSQKNQFAGVDDEDSGGTLAMAFSGVALRVMDELVLSAGVQLPLFENLNGHQDEDAALRAGLAYDF